MNVLITHEVSGVVRRAFRSAGHNAISCDIQEAADGEKLWHIVGDALETICRPVILYGERIRWDIIIMHPPCTALAVSGNAHYAKGKPRYHERLKALEDTERLWKYAKIHGQRVCLENPVGVLHLVIGKPTQTIQPYQFGHDASKATCLRLHNLPPLKPTQRVHGRYVNGVERWSNQTDSGQNKLAPSPTRAAERAETYPGIADAFVKQWGIL